MKSFFTKIYGRRTDCIYSTSGELLSPHVVTNNMWNIPKLKQFKFIQTGEKDYSIMLNVEQGFNDEKNIINVLTSVLGDGCNITISYVDEIPVLASGKRKYIENVWK